MERPITVDVAKDHSSVRGFCLRCRVPWPCAVVKLLLEQDRRAAFDAR